MRHILLVEDDPGLGTGVKMNLEYEGYLVTWVRDLRSARKKNVEETFDLAILDLGLPDGNGISFCTSVRETGSRMPMIILTAQTDEESVVAGLRAGANDYVRKPFGSRELLARIQNALHEPKLREDQLRFGDLLILKATRKVMFDKIEVDLSRREFEVLSYLAENGGNIVTREQLMAHVDKNGDMLDRTIDSHLSHIRTKFKKLGLTAVKLSSIYGVGYTLEIV